MKYHAIRGETRRAVVRMLVFAIIVGGMPLAGAGVIVERAAAPAFTMNICHPLSRGAVGVTAGDLPPRNVFALARRGIDLGAAPPFMVDRVARASQAPDPPPPKALV